MKIKKWDMNDSIEYLILGYERNDSTKKGEIYLLEGFCGDFEEFHVDFPQTYFNRGYFR